MLSKANMESEPLQPVKHGKVVKGKKAHTERNKASNNDTLEKQRN